ncbi:DUF2939 domain-containing protein [Novacetimonas hansenii]|uniref:DUF2939 domain-containing protein n=2 Tax=Novacetimonas hansenii TaxID=436 RepID=A0AAW5EU47_NOVHA|nr:DUF2939 domain-containing protein [Novacetimonas hansenii]EFG85994.1 hypothetical protein GXY_00384 [Novacetimonas hansenii ATCC 23769]MBL7237495.1 DUF2939 domain-containing protein [Novacetimonas hansenii]MCJ8354383.1 DUF2939 domain-containing protein [Novacetimonas hansenii]PYD72183.1 hypothetical protein CFR74_11050 [Novacetimonas hansenii]QOF95384.1 DUF2939 domain-containing protein [Novacetimonas hansenii]
MSSLSRMKIPSSLPEMRRQQARWICAGTFAAATSLYAASPFVTLWSISSAIQNHDMHELGESMRWNSVRDSLKTQAVDELLGPRPAEDDLPAFGASFASTAVSNAIDTRVNENNLGDIVDHLVPQGQAATFTPLAFVQRVHARFVKPGLFETSIVMPGHEGETPLRVQMRIHAFQWQIHRIDLPTSRQPLMEASATQAQPPAITRH